MTEDCETRGGPLQDSYNVEAMLRWETVFQKAISKSLVGENLVTNRIENDEDNYIRQRLRTDNDDFIMSNQGEQAEIEENETRTRFTNEKFERALSSLNIQQRYLFKTVSHKILNDDNQPFRVRYR
ncbi:unnamed protein product [Euphydryas editha]|uniref:Uncharacterized protein n=1 Tax=Euphydryas editha TaxID=104508 RepID=A0AAU9V360_EUPED|nr:unnamed protein product [Euphydryas editha]